MTLTPVPASPPLPSRADTAAFLAIAALHEVVATTFDRGARQLVERALREIEGLT